MGRAPRNPLAALNVEMGPDPCGGKTLARQILPCPLQIVNRLMSNDRAERIRKLLAERIAFDTVSDRGSATPQHGSYARMT